MSSLDNSTPPEASNPSDYERIPAPVSASQRRRRRRRNIRNRMPKNVRRYLRWRILFIAVVSALVLSGVMLTVTLTNARIDLENSISGVTRILSNLGRQDQTEITLDDLDRLLASLVELDGQLELTRNRIALVGPVTRANPDWTASVQLIDSTEQLTNGAILLLQGVEPALTTLVEGQGEVSVNSASLSSGERVVDLLNVGQSRFTQAQNRFRQAEATMQAIDTSQISPDLLLQLETLREFHGQLIALSDGLLNASDLLTTMLGLDSTRTYLVLAQNNDELRPSGGFIGTYGYFRVDNGRIIDYFYSPSTATSPRPPTDPAFITQINPPDWWLDFENPVYVAWDASWTSDFPTTARMALDYYNTGNNPHAPLDGVIALDITGFELMLSALGSVDVPNYDVTITSDNFREAVYDIRAYGNRSETEHKQFVAAMYRAIFAGWQTIDPANNEAMVTALLQALRQRHMMLYFADEEANEVVDLLGWSGIQRSGTDRDYLQVLDTNMGNKSNNSVERRVTYDVTIQPDGSLDSRLALRYDYLASVANADPAVDRRFHGRLDYYNLLQVMLPQGAQLTESSLPRVRVDELAQHTALISRLSVPYDTTQRFETRYTVPDRLVSVGSYEQYTLTIQKQPGARVMPVDITVTLPPNATLISASPQPTEQFQLDNTILNYRLDLVTDLDIQVVFD